MKLPTTVTDTDINLSTAAEFLQKRALKLKKDTLLRNIPLKGHQTHFT